MELTLFQHIITLICLLLLHWLADFLFQSSETGLTKYKNNIVLLKHVLTYTSIMLIVGYCYLIFTDRIDLTRQLLYFCLLTFSFHLTTDYITSKINHGYHSTGQMKKLLNMIAFDQLLHHIQLFLTYYYIMVAI